MAVDHRTATSNEEHNKQHECSLPNLQNIMGTILDIKEKVHNKAHHNICAAQERQKHQYDAKHDSHKVKNSYNFTINFIIILIFSISELVPKFS